MQKGCAKDTFRPFCVRMWPTLMTSVPVKCPLGFKQIHVRFQLEPRSFTSANADIELDLVQQGTSEKVALAVSLLSAFFTGFVLAYIQQWKLALALSSIIPCLVIAGGVMTKFMSGGMQQSLQHVAEGGTVAEEVISTIRTTHAFGSQSILVELYDAHVAKAATVDIKVSIWQGSGLAVFFFISYGAYSLGESFDVYVDQLMLTSLKPFLLVPHSSTQVKVKMLKHEFRQRLITTFSYRRCCHKCDFGYPDRFIIFVPARA